MFLVIPSTRSEVDYARNAILAAKAMQIKRASTHLWRTVRRLRGAPILIPQRLEPTTEVQVGCLDPMDLAKFAVTAIKTDRLEHKIIPLEGETLTIPELSGILSRVSNTHITYEYIGDQAVAENKDQNPLMLLHYGSRRGGLMSRTSQSRGSSTNCTGLKTSSYGREIAEIFKNPMPASST